MARVVRLLPNVDYKKLPLSPVEGAVFLKIDGKITEPEIVKATGFHPDTVQKALDRLISLKACEAVDKAKDQVSKTTKVASGLAFGGNLGKGPFDRRLLDEPGELEADRKASILDAHQRLETLNFYELLGLHRLVDKKEVKAAYYAVAPEFHPDKFFQRKLGIYKQKIEAIFARLTLAHDTLSSKQKRAEYDEYLSTFEASQRATDLASSANQTLAQAQAAIEQQARVAAEAAADAKKQADLVDRKRALAAKLSGGKLGTTAPKPPPVASSAPPQMDPKQAAEALRVRYEYAKQQASRQQVESFVTSGRNLLAQGDFAGAANVFRIARSLMPADPDLAREAEEVSRQASIALADNFARMGEFELQQERWQDAAMSFSKACLGKVDDARVHDRAAYATVRAGVNPRRAAELAKRAVELAPKNPTYRITLALAYAGGGLESSASAELARTLELGPKDEKILALVSNAKESVKALVGQANAKARSSAEIPAVSARSPSPLPEAQPLPAFQPPAGGVTQHPPDGRGWPGSPSHAPQTSIHPHPPHGQSYAQPYAQPPQPPSPQGAAPRLPTQQQGYAPSGFYQAQPGYQQPGYQQPGYQQPGHPHQRQPQQPGYPQPGHPQQPGYQQPGYQQPGYQQPGYQQPGYQQPGYQQQQPGYQTFSPSQPPHAPSGYPTHPQQGYGPSVYPQPNAQQVQASGYPQPNAGYPHAAYPHAAYPQEGYPHGAYPPPPQPSTPPGERVTPQAMPAAQTPPVTYPPGGPDINPLRPVTNPSPASGSGSYSVVNPDGGDRKKR